MTAPDISTTAIVPWYGSNRMLADAAGEAVGDVSVCFIPFAGSLCEVLHIKARQIVASDKHEDLIRLAKVVRDPTTGPQLQAMLKSAVFHEVELREAQDRLRAARVTGGLFASPVYEDDLMRAMDYFIVSWMGRSANCGTRTEANGSLAVRYTGSGGGSAIRYQSAVDSLCPGWAEAFRRCEFVCEDFRVFLHRVSDTRARQKEDFAKDPKRKPDRQAIYCDPPFPGPGDKYLHSFTEKDQAELARRVGDLAGDGARVVMRYYDHPLIRELYPENKWEWRFPKGGRDQHNSEDKPEVLIVAGVG